MNQIRLDQQIQFILEIDKLKGILRQTLLTDGSRRENSAEHSWHIAIMALVLAEYAPPAVDLVRVSKMLLLHDIVEIDAGDTFCYDPIGNQSQAERETLAAQRIFGLLPEEQAAGFRQLWEEFEAQATASAQWAKALDCLQPFLHNQQTQGGTWKQHGITQPQVLKRMSSVEKGAPALWPFVQQMIEDCVVAGYLKPAPEIPCINHSGQ
ncbi:MAG: HD domain-containing protein [Actinomycetota bacterium]